MKRDILTVFLESNESPLKRKINTNSVEMYQEDKLAEYEKRPIISTIINIAITLIYPILL